MNSNDGEEFEWLYGRGGGDFSNAMLGGMFEGIYEDMEREGDIPYLRECKKCKKLDYIDSFKHKKPIKINKSVKKKKEDLEEYVPYICHNCGSMISYYHETIKDWTLKDIQQEFIKVLLTSLKRLDNYSWTVKPDVETGSMYISIHKGKYEWEDFEDFDEDNPNPIVVKLNIPFKWFFINSEFNPSFILSTLQKFIDNLNNPNDGFTEQ